MTGCGGEGMISPEAKPPPERKYGGIAPKKKPLISKDTRRAFFDSADWALCKEGGGRGVRCGASTAEAAADASPAPATSKAGLHLRRGRA